MRSVSVSGMRTAVLRIDVDPASELTAARRAGGFAALRAELAARGAQLLGDVNASEPPREVQILLDTDDADAALAALVRVCARVFGTAPAPGVVTHVSRGTDEDAHGVLAGFGLCGEVTRTLDEEGFDIVHVRLRAADLRRVPDSRVHTALEAALNCEVRLHIA